MSETLLPMTARGQTLSSAGFRASLFPTPDEEQVRAMTAGSGRRCFASYERLCRPTSWQRTFMGSLLTTTALYSPLSYLTWRMRGTKSHHRLYFRLVPSVPFIAEIGYGFVPTPDTTTGAPNAGSNKRNGPKSLMEFARKTKDGLLPTMTTDTALRAGRYAQGGLPLSAAILPTMTARDGRSPQGARDRPNRVGGKSLSQTMLDSGWDKGYLNPKWIEWLMGFPPGWTELH